MANEIKLKRGSGSDPSASDLVVGEIAIRTDTGKLFTKKDDNSVAEISGGGISDGDKGDITVSNSGGTFTIDNDAVTYAKIQNVSATNRILGRDSSGAGVIEEITPANLRTMINVEDGATADQSASEIVALIADQTIAPSTIDMEDNEKIKLGAGDDLELYHTGSANHIDSSTPLAIRSDVFQVSTLNGTHKYIDIPTDEQGVDLYYDNTKRIGTTNTGISVTGNIVVSGTVDGRDLATDGSKLDGIESGATADQTKSDIDALGIAASTAATLATARNIGGVSFNGSANINLPGVNTSGNQDTSGTAAIATTVTVADESSDTSCNVLFATAATGNLAPKSGTNLTFNSSSGVLTATGFAGALTGNVTGNASGSSGSCTGNAATATALETARTIGGTSFDGTANITPAECTNADTVDSLHASSFLRSDAADTMSQSTSGTATLTVTNSGGAGSGIGTGAIVAEFNGDSDGVVIRNIGGGDYSIMNDQQNNGFVLYDGTGGVDIVYNGTVRVEFDSGNTYGDFKGTPSVNGTNLALITDVGGGATGGGSDEVFYENDQNVTTDYTITNGKNAMAAGPITIDSGATVTVGSGETLTIV